MNTSCSETEERCVLAEFNGNHSVDLKILSSVADDEIIGGEADRAEERAVGENLHKFSAIDTGGLPYEIIFVVDNNCKHQRC
ncbi:hypothetical protein TNCV_4770021 [Trichonephila clavipes]|nr:hypothetical protein TNCV_4770021 [Trichonephila clavipes]